jgi:glycosyltransferase involved in cell wall biosynthesis
MLKTIIKTMSSKPTCYFVSLKYAPGLWKEFHLLGNKLREYGLPVKYLISKEYKWMTEGSDSDVICVSSSKNPKQILADTLRYPVGIGRLCARAFRSAPPAFICIYNPHPLNFAIFRLARRFAPGGVRAVYLHEPAKPAKKAYGLKGRFFFEIVELSQKLAHAQSTDVILPSPVAVELFRKYFPDYPGATHYAPLLIPDLSGRRTKKRRYFTMAGRFNFSKRLDAFIGAANYAAERGEDLQFQIVTASPIDEYVQQLTPKARSKMRIINPSKLSDAEISAAVAESFAVLCLHPMVTQSGVLTVAFMNSTPVIARSSPGFIQFIDHKSNGWILADNFSSPDLVEAMISVKNRFNILSANARQTYLDLFAAKNWSKSYAWLLELLKEN